MNGVSNVKRADNNDLIREKEQQINYLRSRLNNLKGYDKINVLYDILSCLDELKRLSLQSSQPWYYDSKGFPECYANVKKQIAFLENKEKAKHEKQDPSWNEFEKSELDGDRDE